MNRKERFLYSDEQTKAELATADNSCPLLLFQRKVAAF